MTYLIEIGVRALTKSTMMVCITWVLVEAMHHLR